MLCQCGVKGKNVCYGTKPNVEACFAGDHAAFHRHRSFLFQLLALGCWRVRCLPPKDRESIGLRTGVVLNCVWLCFLLGRQYINELLE